MESHCSSMNNQRWIKIWNRRSGCGIKVELKISESADNLFCLLFRCPKRSCRFFQWWKLQDDENNFSGNKWDNPVTSASEIRHENSLFNVSPPNSDQNSGNEIELIILGIKWSCKLVMGQIRCYYMQFL